MIVPLEDGSEDVIAKAIAGRGINAHQLAREARLEPAQVHDALQGAAEEEPLRAIASALELDPEALVQLARKAWRPEPRRIPGFRCFTSDYQGIMNVNAYLVWDAGTHEAVAFDSGADASSMIDFIRDKELKLDLILLTHTHRDHVADLQRLRRETGEPEVFCPQQEHLEGSTPFSQGKVFAAGQLSIRSALTSGHSPGGTTYNVEGLDRPVAVVGDALFSCSIGGPKISLPEALQSNRKEIFSLPDDTVLGPGHGPLTTVGEEKTHNPFFPEFK